MAPTIEGYVEDERPAETKLFDNESYVRIDELVGYIRAVATALRITGSFEDISETATTTGNIFFSLHDVPGSVINNILRVGLNTINGALMISDNTNTYYYGLGYNDNGPHTFDITIPAGGYPTILVDGESVVANFHTFNVDFYNVDRATFGMEWDNNDAVSDYYEGTLTDFRVYIDDELAAHFPGYGRHPWRDTINGIEGELFGDFAGTRRRHARLVESRSVYFDGDTKADLPNMGAYVGKLSVWFKPDDLVGVATTPMRLLGQSTWPGLCLSNITGALVGEIITFATTTADRRGVLTGDLEGGVLSAEWHHIEVEWVNSAYQISIDGVVMPTTLAGSNNLISGASWTIGSRRNSGFGEFQGHICDVRFWDTSGNLMAHYPMAEGGDDKLYDVSGNDRHAILETEYSTDYDARLNSAQDVYHYNIVHGFDTAPIFNGAGGYVQLPEINLPQACQLTVHFATWTSNKRHLLIGGPNKTLNFTYEAQSDRFLLETENGNKAWTGIVALYDGEPHEVILTWTDSIALLTVDGVAHASSGFVSSYEGPVTLRIGSSLDHSISDWNFDGTMYDITIRSNMPGSGNPLLHQWNFSDSHGGDVRDQIGDADGVLVNEYAGIWDKQIPARLDGSSLVRDAVSNPPRNGHNGARTRVDRTNDGENADVPSTLWDCPDLLLNPSFVRHLDVTGHTHDRLRLYGDELVGSQLATVMSEVSGH